MTNRLWVMSRGLFSCSQSCSQLLGKIVGAKIVRLLSEKKGWEPEDLRALQSKIALRSKDYASTLTKKCARVFLRVIALRTWFFNQNDLLSQLNTNQPIYFTSRTKILPVKPLIYVGSIQDRSKLIKMIAVQEYDWHSIFSITLSLSLN